MQPLDNLESAQTSEEESKNDKESKWHKQFETKTSFVLHLQDEKIYNITLESVI